MSTAPLRDATRDEMIDYINANASRLQSLRADVDYNLTVSRQKKGKANEFKVTEYTEVSGYLLVRKPAMLRMIVLAPAVRSTLFDIVGDARGFALSIPPQSKFIVGSNQVLKPSIQPLENVRPRAIFDALLLKEIDPQFERAVLVQGTEMVKDAKTHKDVQQADYEIYVFHDEGKDSYLARKIIFSRVDLLPDRELIYNGEGQVVTDASYEDFKNYGGFLFPETVLIDRPVEGYKIQMTFTKLVLNPSLKDEQFALSQPPGYKLVNLDQKNGNTASLSPQSEESSKPRD